MSETQTSLKFKDRLNAIRKPFNQEMLDNFFHLLEINQLNDDKYDPRNHTKEEEVQYEKVGEELSAKWDALEKSIGKSITPEQVLDLKKKQWRKEEETAFNYKHKDGLPEHNELMNELKSTAGALLDAYNNNSYSDSKLAQNYFSSRTQMADDELRQLQHEEDYDLVSIKNKTILEQRWVNLEKALGKIYSLEDALAWNRDLPLDDEATKKFYHLMHEIHDLHYFYGCKADEHPEGYAKLMQYKQDWIDLETLLGRDVTEKEIWTHMGEIWVVEENKDFNAKFNSPSFNKLSREDQEYAIMTAFLHITYSLEAEVLYKDGEATSFEVEPVLTRCNHRWKNLEAKLGHEISNEEVFQWEKTEEEKEKARKRAEDKMKIREIKEEVSTTATEDVKPQQPIIALTEGVKEQPVKKPRAKKEVVETPVVTSTEPEGKKKYLGFSLRRN